MPGTPEAEARVKKLMRDNPFLTYDEAYEQVAGKMGGDYSDEYADVPMSPLTEKGLQSRYRGQMEANPEAFPNQEMMDTRDALLRREHLAKVGQMAKQLMSEGWDQESAMREANKRAEDEFWAQREGLETNELPKMYQERIRKGQGSQSPSYGPGMTRPQQM